jgi:hypothetical protein
MPKKSTKRKIAVQVGQANVQKKEKTDKKTVQVEQANVPKEENIEIKKEPKEETALETASINLDAEEATKVAVEFIESIGIKKTIPTKAYNEGDKAYVELNFKNKKAAVIVDGTTKNILEYEIGKTEKKPHQTNKQQISMQLILVIIGIQLLLLFLFDIIKPYLLNFPFF